MVSPWSFLICGLVFLNVAAGQAPVPSGEETISEARALINAGRPAEAIAKLLSHPDHLSNPGIRHIRGVAHYHANDYAKAIEQLAPITEMFPEGSLERKEAVQVLGMSYYLAGQVTKSLPFLEQTASWAGDNPEFAYVLGMAYVQTRQPGKARGAFAKMFRVPPDSAAAHLLTAPMMIRVDLQDLAEAELKQALEKDPKLPQANLLLGQIASNRSRFDESVILLEREIAVNPGNAMAFYQLGFAYTRLLREDEAIAPLQKSIWLNPYYSGPYILLGKIYLKKQQLKTAEGMLRRAVKFDPNHKTAHFLLGQALQRMGRVEEAKEEFAIAERLYGEVDR
jgi:tetratricopeptide (TPR) repeat protein